MARRLMLDAARLIPPELQPRAPEAIERVALVAPYIGHRFHTPSKMAADQATILADTGLQVQIFSAQELLPPDAAQFRGDGRELALPPLDAQAWASLLPAGVRMTVSDSRFSLPGRWRNLFPALAAFDPDVIFLVGLFSPLAAALHTVRPLVGLSVNTVVPIAPLDVWLTADADAHTGDFWSKTFPAPQGVFHPYRIRRSTQAHAVTRVELGLDEAAVVWVSAGFRLEHEIRNPWAERMLQLMEIHPQVVWLLVGGEGKLPKALAQAPPGRVRVLATRNDLPGILRIGDIYVNPPRMGGGISVAEAMAEGMPVTALAGSDGGDKLGELALADLDAYDERLAALTGSAQLRADLGAALRQRFDQRLDLAASGPALLQACHQAAGLARARLTRPS
jgi:glycosyltransferase involved in cell wall biosynthesis